MIILPAIDLCGGNCVRLLKGDFNTVQKVAESPLKAAASFEQAGARWLHMVDLDGAKTGGRPNRESIVSLSRKTKLRVELGGGIRTMQAVEDYLQNGVERVILGSAALKDPAFVEEAVAAYGERIAVGIDARDGLVASEGWLVGSQTDYIDFAKNMEQIGVTTIIFTDIARDGTLSGPPLERLAALQSACGCRIIASGGISNIGDIRALARMGLYGAICGKSIYSGSLDLAEAIREGGAQDAC